MGLARPEEELPAEREIAHLGDGEPERPVGHELVGVQIELRREAGLAGGAQGPPASSARGRISARRRRCGGGQAGRGPRRSTGKSARRSVPVAARRPRASAASATVRLES